MHSRWKREKIAAEAAPSKHLSWKQTRTLTGLSACRALEKKFTRAKPIKMDAGKTIVKWKAGRKDCAAPAETPPVKGKMEKIFLPELAALESYTFTFPARLSARS